jgi:8-oxo-dGTP pyrophosphatase MutT (NUDIX family)
MPTLGERIAASRAFDVRRFVPFQIDDAIAGYVRRDFVAHLAAFPQVFRIDERIGFVPGLNDRAARTVAMAQVAKALAARGLLTPWRSETYAITAAERPQVLFELERCAVRFFGFMARAVHVNGLARGAGAMWIAQRSATKAIDPGMFDNMVGGGIASGASAEATLVKEAWEEAGIQPPLAARAAATSVLHVRREVPDGLHAEILYVYDLMLPDAFVPANQDGEVQGFRLLELEAVRTELESAAPYTADAALVALDCLARLGCIPGLKGLSSPD